MTNKQAPKLPANLRWWTFSSSVVASTGVVGLLFVLNQIHPESTAAAEPLLFFLIFLTFGAGIIPMSVYLHHRFVKSVWLEKDPNRLLRHGLEMGILVVVLAYLQRTQDLDWTIASVLVSVFILMEMFFLTRG